jgi:hypothetical protein
MQGPLDAHRRRLLLTGLIATPFFTFLALEYRVDSLSTVLTIFAALAHAKAFRNRGWALGTGALWNLVALANLRLAPLALCGIVLALVLDPEARRWRVNPRFLSVAAGALLPVLIWVALLLLTHSLGAAFQRTMVENAASNASLPIGGGRVGAAMAPLVNGFDLPGLLLLGVGLAGMFLALLEIRKPGPIQALALLQLSNILFIFKMRVHYPYHFQAVIFLMVPLAAHAINWVAARKAGFRAWPRVALAVLALQLAWNGWSYFTTQPCEDWAYQDTIIRAAETETRPDQKVLDGCGPVLKRDPAYQYWFLPLLVRMLSSDGRLERYPLNDFIQKPPGAVLYNVRMGNWLQENPALLKQAITHFLPDYPNLWLPGLSGVLTSEHPQLRFVVPVSGEYRVLASPQLASHPWFQSPLSVGLPRVRIDPSLTLNVATFPSEGLASLHWKVNGQEQEAGVGRLQLKQGDLLEVTSMDAAPIGLLVVPANRTVLFRSPKGTPDYDVLTFYKDS